MKFFEGGAASSPGINEPSPSSSSHKSPGPGPGGMGVGGKKKSLRLKDVNSRGGDSINVNARLLRDRSWRTVEEVKGGAAAAAALAQKKRDEAAAASAAGGGGGKRKGRRKNRGLFGGLLGGGKEEEVEEEAVVEVVEYVALVSVLDEPYVWPQVCDVLGCVEGEMSLHSVIDALIFQIESDPLYEVSEGTGHIHTRTHALTHSLIEHRHDTHTRTNLHPLTHSTSYNADPLPHIL